MTEPAKAVFLSYASQDAEAAEQIAAALRTAGIEVWFDQSELRGGDAWDHKIKKQIRECALFVAVISAHTDARPEGYFRREWKLAVDRTHDMADDEPFLVPIVIDETADATARVPEKFREVHWTPLPAGTTPPSFVERISHLLSPDIRPAPTLPAGAQTMIPEKSIAVLAFANLSADKENEYFSDGLAEEILNALSQVEDLRVASRSSAFSFKGKAAEIGEIARKLRVANVLEGSVRRAGNRLRITVQLVDVKNGFQLWSERYDRQMENIFEIQDDIARAITERLRVTLGAGAERSTTNLDAYELYLRGRYHWHQRSPATLRAAIQCFERSTKLDPRYALAYAGLADCYGILRFYGLMSAEGARLPARAAITQARALAPSLWEVDFSRAFYIFHFERDWHEAEACFQQALALNPRSSLVEVYYGFFLMTEGRGEDAVTHAMLACQLDPLSPFIHSLASVVLGESGRFEAAERIAQHALELQPDFWLGLMACARVFYYSERYQQGNELMERVATLSRAPFCLGVLGTGYARAGRHDDARQLLRELEDRASSGEYIPACAPMGIYVGLGDLPEIRATFARAVAEPMSAASILAFCGHFLDPFRADPEIDRMHREIFGW